jgi:hypothetical protein
VRSLLTICVISNADGYGCSIFNVAGAARAAVNIVPGDGINNLIENGPPIVAQGAAVQAWAFIAV